MTSPEEMGNGPVIHDRRRIDPVTGQVRETDRPRGRHAAPGQGDAADAASGAEAGGAPRHGSGAEPPAGGSGSAPGHGGAAQSAAAPAAAAAADNELAALRAQLTERTADLQRVQAEYANYRKRVDRDRTAVREFALAGVLTELLPVLDAIERARQHDELSGGFKSVAESLESAVAKLGLVSYGKPGEAFDPQIHEALTHTYSADVTDVTCVEILQPGYKMGDRILRPARVAVAEPATGPDGVREAGPEGPVGSAASGDAAEQPDSDEETSGQEQS